MTKDDANAIMFAYRYEIFELENGVPTYGYELAQAVKDAGATELYAGCTHAVLSGPAVERLDKSAITKLVMLDTVCLPDVFLRDKFSILTTADIFAVAIENVYLDRPMSKLYD